MASADGPEDVQAGELPVRPLFLGQPLGIVRRVEYAHEGEQLAERVDRRQPAPRACDERD
jgi:hypothetical protein